MESCPDRFSSDDERKVSMVNEALSFNVVFVISIFKIFVILHDKISSLRDTCMKLVTVS